MNKRKIKGWNDVRGLNNRNIKGWNDVTAKCKILIVYLRVPIDVSNLSKRPFSFVQTNFR
jgi:hypothetical protein